MAPVQMCRVSFLGHTQNHCFYTFLPVANMGFSTTDMYHTHERFQSKGWSLREGIRVKQSNQCWLMPVSIKGCAVIMTVLF